MPGLTLICCKLTFIHSFIHIFDIPVCIFIPVLLYLYDIKIFVGYLRGFSVGGSGGWIPFFGRSDQSEFLCLHPTRLEGCLCFFFFFEHPLLEGCLKC